MAERRTAYLDGCLQFQENGLVYEDFACFRAEVLDLILLELHGLPRSIASHFVGRFLVRRPDATRRRRGTHLPTTCR